MTTHAGQSPESHIAARAAELSGQYEHEACRRTDLHFAVLMLLQWLVGIAVALWYSPQTWTGTTSGVHPHLVAAVFLGALVNLGPMLLAVMSPGGVVTRHVIAVGQALASALLIHLTDGRIETHFHVFGSLAFLAFYRDWRVLVTATLVVAGDHLLRGLFVPLSIYGSPDVALWRTIEHAGWVAFEDVFLMLSIFHVRQATNHAAVQQAAAESANRAKSAFLAAISHDLRTPLNGILGMNDLLRGTELTSRQREFIEASHTSGRLLLQLINNVLDLSKMESGRLELDLHECSVEAVVYDVVEALGPGAAQKGLTLKVHTDPAANVTAACDGNRLRQILVNLVGNAIKFTPIGTVAVNVTCARRDAQRLHVRFEVSDSGIGIPKNRRDRLFCPFTQVDNSTTREFGGSGLGLAICNQLVELMDGSIGIDSQIGIGSTFWFEVPLRVLREAPSIATIGDGRGLAGTRVLLVANPDCDVADLVESLRAWGCRTELAVTVRRAIATVTLGRAMNTPWDVVLAELPPDAASRRELIDTLSRSHGLPVIGFGGAVDDCDVSRLAELGLRQLLHSPVRSSALYDALISTRFSTSSSTSQESPGRAVDEAALRELRGHVLVAEDNHINQMYVTELLKNCGCTCEIASNGDEVLAALQRHRYDLVLMDCQMPEMDGFTAARELRRREAAGESVGRMPVIALTANALKGDRERCLEAGMDDYLAKPLQAAQLQAMLMKHLAPVSVQTEESRKCGVDA